MTVASNNTPNSLRYAIYYAEKLNWLVIPIHSVNKNGLCSCGEPGDRLSNGKKHSKGKHPLLPINWPEEATTDLNTINRWWRQWPYANVGIVTGERSGIIVIDLDVKEDKDGVNEFYNVLLPKIGCSAESVDTAEQVTHSGGKQLFFKYPTDKSIRIKNGTNVLGSGIDIRSDGGYVVAPPSIGVKGSYFWEGSNDPTDGFELKELPEEILNVFRESHTKAIENNKKNNVVSVNNRPHQIMGADDYLSLKSALRFWDHDDYQEWIDVGLALKRFDPGMQMFNLWSEWSSSYEKYTERECIKTWKDLNIKEDHESPITTDTIYWKAQARGWINPNSKTAQRFNEKEKALIDKVNNRENRITVIDEENKEVLLFNDTSLTDLSKWIYFNNLSANNKANTHAVISIVSALTNRRYINEYNEMTNTYCCIVGSSIGELSYINNSIDMLFDQLDHADILFNKRFNTISKLYQFILDDPSGYYVSNDYGQLLGLAKRQPSGSQEWICNEITNLYDRHKIVISIDDVPGCKEKFNNERNITIYKPSLNMLSLFSFEQLSYLMEAKEVGRGAVEKMLFCFTDKEDVDSKSPIIAINDYSVPKSVVSKASSIIQSSKQQSDQIPVSPYDIPDLIRVRNHIKFNEQYLSFCQNIDSLAASCEKDLKPIITGHKRSYRKIGAALAAWLDPVAPVISESIAGWTAAYVQSCFADFLSYYETAQSDAGIMSTYDAVLSFIRRCGVAGAAERDIRQYVRKYRSLPTKKARNDLLSMLLEDGEVYENRYKAKNNKTVSLYIHRKFVKTDESPDKY